MTKVLDVELHACETPERPPGGPKSTRIAGDGECRKDERWQVALGLLADVAENTGQHNTITASLAIAPARRMKIGSWH